MNKYEWQDCSEKEIEMFENFFEEGAAEITMMGVPDRITESYKDYYNWRSNCDDGEVEILDNDY